MNITTLLADAAPAAAASQQSLLGPWMLPLLLIAIFYVALIRPQQRKEKERRKMIEELRAGAKIVFAGGLMGTIVEATEKTFKVEICPGTTVEIDRSCVQGVVTADAK